jgi:putative membrane protein
MTSTPETRKPRLFAVDDPALVEEQPDSTAADSGQRPEPGAGAGSVTRPTLGDLGARGLRWGALLVSALAGAAALGAAAWFYRLVGVALARDDWIGWTTLALLLTAAFAALMLLLREVVGFSRLARLARLRREVTAAIAERDRKRERKATAWLARLYARRPDLAYSVTRFRAHARDVHDPGELLALAERELLVPLDQQARRLITQSAKRVATVTAMSPMLLIAVGYVLIENLRLLRMLATLYGGRPGVLGAMRLGRLVFLHIVATGGVAMTDDLLGQFLGQDVLRRLSRRLGEGAFNGALTARIGIAAIEVIRPLPYLAVKAPRVREILGEVLKPLFAGKKAAT